MCRSFCIAVTTIVSLITSEVCYLVQEWLVYWYIISICVILILNGISKWVIYVSRAFTAYL